MNFSFNESRLLYGLGAFLGIVSIIYFGQQLILDLSPTVKSFILLSGSAAFLSAAEYVDLEVLTSSFYIFSAFSYLSFLVYTVSRFSFGREQVFLVLAFSSAVFMALGYLRGSKGYEFEKQKARKVLAVLAGLVLIVVIFDVVGDQPEHSIELENSVEVVEKEEFSLGTLNVENSFWLSRNIEVPRFRGCISKSGDKQERIYIRPDSRDLVAGKTTEKIELSDSVMSRPDHSNQSFSGNYNVVEGECPSSPEEETIYIHEAGDDRQVVSEVID